MESFSVKAVLSALDKGFTSTIKSSVSSLNGIKNAASSATSSIMKIASGIGVFKAVSAIGNGITGLIGDMGEASAAWKTFEGNMTMNGTAASEIQDIKKELQDFEMCIRDRSGSVKALTGRDDSGTKSKTARTASDKAIWCCKERCGIADDNGVDSSAGRGTKSVL